jgi:hypothetical protein
VQSQDVKAKETKKCLYRDVDDDDDLVEFCQLSGHWLCHGLRGNVDVFSI